MKIKVMSCNVKLILINIMCMILVNKIRTYQRKGDENENSDDKFNKIGRAHV